MNFLMMSSPPTQIRAAIETTIIHFDRLEEAAKILEEREAEAKQRLLKALRLTILPIERAADYVSFPNPFHRLLLLSKQQVNAAFAWDTWLDPSCMAHPLFVHLH